MPSKNIIQVFFIYAVLLLPLRTTASSESSCPDVEVLEGYSKYVYGKVECNNEGTLIFLVYEDCPQNKMIFKVEGFTIDDCNGQIYLSDDQFGFATPIDAESNSQTVTCPRFLTQKNDLDNKVNTQFQFVDVNEYPPQPVGELDIVQSLEFEENDLDAHYQFSYIDPDYKETETLTCKAHFSSADATMFEVETKGYDEEKEVMLFLLKVKKGLDFETKSFYNLLVEIKSTDTRRKVSSLNQTFFITVEDLGDNPPLFTQIQPSATCDEESLGKFIFQVDAQDRDVGINNAILYSIESGNEDKFFEINNLTGEVSTSKTKRFDRETAESILFALEIQAMEVLDDDGTPAPEPAKTSQVTNVNFLDINDNIPIFDNANIEVEIDEFDETQSQGSKTLDLLLTVTDMDEGEAGGYTLSTKNPNVVIDPNSGFGKTEISITLLESDDFDYEAHSDNPIVTVEIIATEKVNASHSSKATLKITLNDINDKPPVFDKCEYQAELKENIPGGTEILQVNAKDQDITPEFGENSLVYFLHNCGEKLDIEETTGQISLSDASELDYEKEKRIDCTVIVKDMEGSSYTSLSDEVGLIIVVTDVNDELPSIGIDKKNPEILEDAEINSVVTSIEVTDPDTEAYLKISMEFEDGVSSSVKDWFALRESKDSTPSGYKGDIVVASKLDRETAEKVAIQIKAVDENAAKETQEKIESLQVVIIDVNDESPKFEADYSSQKVDENTPEDTVIFTVSATDPDKDDQITFSIIDHKDYLKIDPNTGDVSVKAKIDREVTPEFKVEIVASDKKEHSDKVQINVNVIDMNDNKPLLDAEICLASHSVPEDAEEGYIVTTITATDKDEGIHADISYSLQNSNHMVENIQFAPFAIDNVTGEISIHITKSNKLDRELQSKWILVIDAFDSCDSNDPKCEVKYDECMMTIDVEDVNDNGPGAFLLSTGTTIITDENLLKGNQIQGLEVSAVDPDQPNNKNSELSFDVVSMTSADSTVTDLLFKAVTKSRNSTNTVEFYCTLEATVALSGLQGDYLIEIKATDKGIPQQHNSQVFPLSIQDVNDMSPVFSFSRCLIDSDQSIHMKENLTPLDTPLKCTSDGSSDVAEIMVTDADKPQTSNSEVMLEIDYESSVAIDAGPDNQLKAFQIFSYGDAGRFAISIRELINRESGMKYNLSLVAKDKGTIPNETPSWIFIIVEDIPEFPPVFCEESPCKETVSFSENSIAAAKFSPAVDKDNSEDEINELVYYMILDSHVFEILDPTVPEIKPVDSLDREKCDKYHVSIWAYNEPADSPETENSNQILSVTVEVLDVNDETPSYDGVIYGEFSDTGSKLGEEVAVLEFLDKDLKDSLSYEFAGKFFWSEGYNYPDPFKIERLDDRKSKITLNIDPQGKSGYCSFQVQAKDEASHTSLAQVEVFVVTNEYLVSFHFLNDKEEVDKNQNDIEKIFSLVFGYTCIIDSITIAKDEGNNEIEGQTLVLAHFIREKRATSDNNDNTEPLVLKMKNQPKRRSHTTLLNENLRQNNNLTTREIRQLFTEGRYHLNKRGKEQLNSRKERHLADSHLDHSLLGYIQRHMSQNKGSMRIPGKRPLITEEEQSSGGDQVEYELVPKEEIEKMGASGTITSQLDSQLEILGLNLARIGDVVSSDPSSANEQVIINLKITLAASVLFMGLLIVLLVILFFVRTTKLKREIKALSAQSVAEGKLDEKRFETTIPGSNLYASEGTNPIWNLKEDAGCAANVESSSSSESALTGAENNLMFHYQPPKKKDLEVEKPRQKDDPIDIFADSFQNSSGSRTKVTPWLKH